jgi:hypothetical protein
MAKHSGHPRNKLPYNLVVAQEILELLNEATIREVLNPGSGQERKKGRKKGSW